MKVIRAIQELKEAIVSLRTQGRTIGFVPTMGALHEGHLSLIDIAGKKSDIVVTSIFVNKAQFAPHEDFADYPRPEAQDLAKLKDKKVDIAYLPSHEDMYPEGDFQKISVGDIGNILEGVARPHFFDGVALVVTKLFEQVKPNIAVFGEKDYQQFVIIKKLVRERDIPVEIIGAPICREKDGLAMSSRNIYLNNEQRKTAQNLYKTLCIVKEKLKNTEGVRQTLDWGKNNLLQQGFSEVDYLELCNSENLSSLNKVTSNARLLAVARLGEIRLLDNIEV